MNRERIHHTPQNPSGRTKRLLAGIKSGVRSGIPFGILAGLLPGVLVGIAGTAWFMKSSSPENLERPTPTQEPARPGVPLPDQGRLSLFVLAGQSNMSGRGVVLPSTRVEHIYAFGNDYHWKQAQEPIDSAEGQVDSVSLDRNAGLGPGLAFAQRLAELLPGRRIGLIPCAKGATTIFEWERRLGDDTLYGSCMKRIRAASMMGHIEGFLFFQGEWDAFDENDADAPLAWVHVPPTKLPNSRVPFHADSQRNGGSLNRVSYQHWKSSFEDLVDSVRADTRVADLPVVFARIGTHKDPRRYVHWDDVQKQQDEVSMPRVAMIKTEDLPLADTVHFETQSYVTIGRRFAESYAAMVDPSIRRRLEGKEERERIEGH